MSNPHSLTVGKQLWMVPWRGEPHFVTLTKVGRKYATFLEYSREKKIHLETLREESDWPCCCYLSREEYEDRQRLVSLWGAFRDAVPRYGGAPDGVTQTDILNAAELLKLKIGEKA